MSGVGAAITTLVLIAIEIAFSFDNAIINATVLKRLSRGWQHLFLTAGMVIAILGMRLIFPILIVMVTAKLSWSKVIDDALHHPTIYAHHLADAHLAISAFGGAFLLTLAFYFLLDDERDVLWLKRIEKPLQAIGGTLWLPPLLTILIVLLLGQFTDGHFLSIMKAGLLGAVGYAAIKTFIEALGRLEPRGNKLYTGWAALLAFMYLQVLDASFSFDGVLGAFAVTNKVLLIALGLGVGALWVRSLTVFMVRKGTLDDYIYLEHGAHYAILVLAAALLSSIFYDVPNVLTGIVGLGIIGASFKASHERRQAKLRAIRRAQQA